MCWPGARTVPPPLEVAKPHVMVPSLVLGRDGLTAAAARELTRAIADQHAGYRGPTVGITLQLSVTLFGAAQGRQVPLVSIAPLLLDVTGAALQRSPLRGCDRALGGAPVPPSRQSLPVPPVSLSFPMEPEGRPLDRADSYPRACCALHAQLGNNAGSLLALRTTIQPRSMHE